MVAPPAAQTQAKGTTVSEIKGIIVPRLIDMSKVKPMPKKWFWHNKIPYGDLTVLAGLPKKGKSVITIYAAAHASQGKAWPDGTSCEHGSVLFFSGEDSISVCQKRLEANGADLTKIRILDGAQYFLPDGTEGTEMEITLSNLSVIESAINQTEQETGLPVGLVIIDPLSNFLGTANENNNLEVRRVL